MRFVFDTNALVSVVLSPDSTNKRALQKALESGEIVFSQSTISELTDVFARSKFDRYVAIEKRMAFVDYILAIGKTLDITPTIKICRDENDDKWLDLAVASGASCIITGDPDLLVLNPFRGIPIVTARDFLEKL